MKKKKFEYGCSRCTKIAKALKAYDDFIKDKSLNPIIFVGPLLRNRRRILKEDL